MNDGATTLNAKTTVAAGRNPVALATLLILLGLIMLWFVTRRIHYVSDISVRSYSDYFWPRRWGLLMHLAGGVTAISTGLVQLWTGLTGRTRALHRTLGRIYVGAICIGAAGGLYLGLTIPGHLAYRSGLIALAVTWLVTTAMAVVAIRNRDIVQHRGWMIRSYTVTFAFVIYRLVLKLLRPMVHVPDDPVATELDATMAWACWVVPLFIAELAIQLKAMRFKRR